MPDYTLSNKRIWVTGHAGLVGSAVVRALERGDDTTILTARRTELDLRDAAAVRDWLRQARPDSVIHAAAHVGSVLANVTRPAEFLHDNLMIAANVIHAAHETGVRKLLFVATSSVYPKFAPQPITEDALLSGKLDPSNEAYALAKIAGIKLCQAFRTQYGADFIAALPCNLYGPNDRFDEASGHVLPSLLLRFHQAAAQGTDSVTLWGTGTPRREFLHADDLAEALLFLMAHYSDAAPINVGTGTDVAIRDLAAIIREVTGFQGRIDHDTTKPDGVASRLMDSSRLTALGWTPRIDLRSGIASLYQWLLENRADLRGHV
jgi:GDP-L-fucose synthase